MDLYSKQIGSNFSDIDSFSAYIGGSPTNIAVCSQRLGLKTALLSAVGDDLTGKFIMDKLIKENVSTSNMFVIPKAKTNLVLCGIIPPDQFPLVFYREKAPEKSYRDMYLDADGIFNKDELSTFGYLASGVPGTVAGLWEVHKQFGSLPWKDLLEDAIFYAEEGFEISPYMADILYKYNGSLRV